MTETPETIEEVRKILGCSEGQSLLERARHYANKEKFLPVEDLVVAIVRVEGGLAPYMGRANRGEYKSAWAELNLQIHNMLNMMDIQRAREKEKSDLVLPK